MMSGKIGSIVLCLGWILILFLGMLMLMVGAMLFATTDGPMGFCIFVIGAILVMSILEARESFFADFLDLIERLTK